jgi:hypothetical protein
MTLVDVKWAPFGNVLIVRCDCGGLMSQMARYSVVHCPNCHREELWHSIDPKPKEGPWSLPEMKICLTLKPPC